MDIGKAIIPAAGLGTRFFPITKTIPKEMLPILTKPAFQIIVEEALHSLSTFLIITNNNKQVISDFFGPQAGLEAILKERNQEEGLASINRIIRQAEFSYIHQPEPRGLGHAIWLARHLIGKEHFAILLPDDIITGEQPALAQLIRVARQEKASVVAVQEVPEHMLQQYGVITIKKQITPNLYQVASLIEKPTPQSAPSNLAVVGRYVLSPKIFHALENHYAANDGEEMQLTDAITRMLHNNERVFAYKLQGTRYDIGTPLGWLKATVSYALRHSAYSAELQEFLLEHHGIATGVTPAVLTSPRSITTL